jgi:hypothetical protein
MPVKTELSDAALALFRYRLATNDNRVTDANREAYRELGNGTGTQLVSDSRQAWAAFHRATTCVPVPFHGLP